MKQAFKKLLSILLCIIIIVVTDCRNIHAQSISDKYQRIHNKIISQLDGGLDAETVYSQLSSDEINVLMKAYDTDENISYAALGFDDDVINSEEVTYIDDLADSYYNYYIKYGEFPDEDSHNNLERISSKLNDKSYNGTFSFTYEDVFDESSTPSIIQKIGYYYSASKIATHLVLTGIKLGIAKALPFLLLVALLCGIGIITFSAITIAYCGVAVGVNQLVQTWYLNSTSELNRSKVITLDMVAEKEKGYNFWLCNRANNFGLGGIRIINPISDDQAKATVIADKEEPNVFAYDFNRATWLGSTCSKRYGIIMDKPHNVDKYPLNLPHIHIAVAPSVSGKTHIFYPGVE